MPRGVLIAVRAVITQKPGILMGRRDNSRRDSLFDSGHTAAAGCYLIWGEPFAQAEVLAAFAKQVKVMGLDIVTYTGYTFEELLEMSKDAQGIKLLLERSDFLVDGPYLASERDLSISYRGSRNQRFLDVAASLAAARAVEIEL